MVVLAGLFMMKTREVEEEASWTEQIIMITNFYIQRQTPEFKAIGLVDSNTCQDFGSET